MTAILLKTYHLQAYSASKVGKRGSVRDRYCRSGIETWPETFRLWVEATEADDKARLLKAPLTKDHVLAAWMLTQMAPLSVTLTQTSNGLLKGLLAKRK